MARIKVREEVSCSAHEIRTFLEDKVAHFKIPRYIWFVEQFPTTVTGKLQKFRMREVAIEKMKSG